MRSVEFEAQETGFDYQRKAGGRTPVSWKLMRACATELLEARVNPYSGNATCIIKSLPLWWAFRFNSTNITGFSPYGFGLAT